jgi:hypothetical protein
MGNSSPSKPSRALVLLSSERLLKELRAQMVNLDYKNLVLLLYHMMAKDVLVFLKEAAERLDHLVSHLFSFSYTY